jgi:hypothetical protein
MSFNPYRVRWGQQLELHVDLQLFGSALAVAKELKANGFWVEVTNQDRYDVDEPTPGHQVAYSGLTEDQQEDLREAGIL